MTFHAMTVAALEMAKTSEPGLPTLHSQTLYPELGFLKLEPGDEFLKLHPGSYFHAKTLFIKIIYMVRIFGM